MLEVKPEILLVEDIRSCKGFPAYIRNGVALVLIQVLEKLGKNLSTTSLFLELLVFLVPLNLQLPWEPS